MRWIIPLGLTALVLAPSQAVPMTHGPAALVAQSERFETTPASPLSLSGATVLEQAADGLYYVDALVNGKLVHFVVDTGSSVVVLNAKDAARAGVGSAGPMHVDTANGGTSMQRARIQRVSLGGQTLTDIEAAVVGHDLEVSLLGQSALSRLASVTLRDGRLELHVRADAVVPSPPA